MAGKVLPLVASVIWALAFAGQHAMAQSFCDEYTTAIQYADDGIAGVADAQIATNDYETTWATRFIFSGYPSCTIARINRVGEYRFECKRSFSNLVEASGYIDAVSVCLNGWFSEKVLTSQWDGEKYATTGITGTVPTLDPRERAQVPTRRFVTVAVELKFPWMADVSLSYWYRKGTED